MKRLIIKLDGMIAACEKSLLVLLFLSLALIILFNIVTRNFFHLSFQSAVEVAPALVLWLALIGSTLALKHQRHIRLELVLRFCPAPVKRWAGVLTAGFGLGIMVILFFASLEFMKNEVSLFGVKGWLSAIFPVFFALSAFRYVTRLIQPTASGDTPNR